ncbi:hypothetical protein [Streptomyces galilaeus]|uniref:Uncharacterized protein n=1 Tax=Streptomyces galilaeus TaxID=33899 RepID=A0ABW9ITL2_STRGJ
MEAEAAFRADEGCDIIDVDGLAVRAGRAADQVPGDCEQSRYFANIAPLARSGRRTEHADEKDALTGH